MPEQINQPEKSVQDDILEMLDADAKVAADVKDVVLNAVTAVGHTDDSGPAHPAATYLYSLSVAGFRGVGPAARLNLYPAPGLTVVSGRNGSGKSSFAEALELVLTGTSYRWHRKETLWKQSWQNLHHPSPCEIRAEFTREGADPVTVGMDWTAGAELSERSAWTQTADQKRVDGTEGLGWSRPLEVYRPMLSYDELGRLFDGGPAALYDALDKLLGLEVLADAEKWLAAELKTTKSVRGRADAERKTLREQLLNAADERAQHAGRLLAKKAVSIDEVLALATGADDAQQQLVPALKAMAALESPSLEDVSIVAARLRIASHAAVSATTSVAELTRARIDVLSAAVRFHDHAGDSDCPVCGGGRLDADWANAARATIADSEQALGEYSSATAELTAAREAATALLSKLATVQALDGVDLPALADYNTAATAAASAPDDDHAMADHLESAVVEALGAAEALRAQAADVLSQRESTWAPLAAQLAAWVPVEQQARDRDDTVKTITAAKKWMTDQGGTFRNRRLEPIAAQARAIWSQLRQGSNVDLSDITLAGTANRRHAILDGSVDGQPTKALPVMSQGEQHAVALALFLPRATAPGSPFRFVVLDDPIQAMDPSKIDGFVQVLSGIARTHQVVVFSHDDRLASVIRETGVDARLVQVVRETASRISLSDNINPALRQVDDVFALINDDRLPDDIKRRAVPSLFRTALESAARQAYFTKQAKAGVPRDASETAWSAAKKTAARLALVVLGNSAADLTGWLDSKQERRRSLKIGNAGAHGAAGPVDIHDARDLERTVKEVLALA